MPGKTFELFKYSDDATLDQIEDAIDALQDAPLGDWVEVTFHGGAWLLVDRNADGFAIHCSWRLPPVNAPEVKPKAIYARRVVGRMLYQRFEVTP